MTYVAKQYTFGGLTMTLKEWSKHMGVTHRSLQDRIRMGWSEEQTFTRPNRRGREHTGKRHDCEISTEAFRAFNAWSRMPLPTGEGE